MDVSIESRGVRQLPYKIYPSTLPPSYAQKSVSLGYTIPLRPISLRSSDFILSTARHFRPPCGLWHYPLLSATFFPLGPESSPHRHLHLATISAFFARLGLRQNRGSYLD